MRHLFNILSASLILAPAVTLATSPMVTTAAGKLEGVGTAGVDNMVQALRIPAGASL
jgi:hypothetical protein